MHSIDDLRPTERFDDRVEAYVRHRPGYPPALMAWLRQTQGLTPDLRVADIGAGTGISTRLWLDAGHPVVVVEPNAAMRGEAQARLTGSPHLEWRAATAEATGLADASVDVVSAAQAFHWFDPDAARREWARILRPDGVAVVFWNSRIGTGTPFRAGYEHLLRAFGTDYDRVAERHPDDDAMQRWFGAGFRGMACFDHAQRMDFDALSGRLRSSSYAPQPGHPRYDAMIAELQALFERTAVGGHVDFEYRTRVFVGTLR